MKQLPLITAYKCIYGIVYVISLLPMSFLYAFASFVYFFLYHVFGYEKVTAIQNIARSFPDKKYNEVSRIVKRFYVCLSDYAAEIIKSISIDPEKLGKQITFENTDIIDKYIASGKSVIASSGHCGNWEMLSFLLPYKLSHNVYAPYKPLKIELFNLLMLKIRSRFGLRLIPSKSIVRHILTEKSSPSVYLFLADQCPKTKNENYKFSFLNQETYFLSGMEELARVNKAAVIYLHITQTSKGNYTIKCVPLSSETELTGKGQITQKYAALLSENIQEAPHGWLWAYKRWKI